MSQLGSDAFGHLGEDEREAQSKVEAVILTAIDAHTRTDYAKFSTLCTDEFIDQIDEEVFVETCTELNPRLGPLETLDYLGCLDRIELVQFLWKANFHAAQEQVLVTASFAKAKNIPLIEWLWIE